MKRINVIGTTASGKSTFAKKLSKALGIPYIEMDLLFWKKNWVEKTNEEFFPLLKEKLKKETWVLDGNFSRTNLIKWREVDTIIWIDYSFTRTLYQSILRALKRIVSRKELWKNTGNKESFGRLFSKDSIVLWLFKTYRKKKNNYPIIMNNEKYKHIKFIRLKNPRESKKFLTSLR